MWELILRLFGRRRRAAAFRWSIGPVDRCIIQPLDERSVWIMLLLTDTQKVSLSVQPVTATGKPARVDGPPAWTVSDPSILTLEVADDGLSAVVKATGAVGLAQVNVTADADLGSGIETISGLLDIEVQPGKAVSLAINAGTPEEQ